MQSHSKIQKDIEDATEGQEPEADHQGSNTMIDDGGHCQINKGAQTKEDISVTLEKFVPSCPLIERPS